MKKLYLFLFLITIFSATDTLPAQTWSLKSDLLYLSAGMTPNLSVEAALSPKWTIELQGSYNPWRLSGKAENKKLKHWLLRSGGRYWIYEKFDGHFLGFDIHYGRYNAGGVKLPLGVFPGLTNNRFEGYGMGASFSYGYQWYLGPHWNLEATFGFGYSYLNYSMYECARCGDITGNPHKHYFGPTRIGLSAVYLIKSKRY